MTAVNIHYACIISQTSYYMLYIYNLFKVSQPPQEICTITITIITTCWSN